jgi:hypothetical protein
VLEGKIAEARNSSVAKEERRKDQKEEIKSSEED